MKAAALAFAAGVYIYGEVATGTAGSVLATKLPLSPSFPAVAAYCSAHHGHDDVVFHELGVGWPDLVTVPVGDRDPNEHHHHAAHAPNLVRQRGERKEPEVGAQRHSMKSDEP
eukprot:CAMPEP_0178996406 /NCGR_PEP_ID=MMETSP0795-20121207/8351_1 /TAXON_ID=88552 /ORGANISM="Amoebophrya sp., Strain Ameob2" /LENGTH=112 /DNA_ID=CAMNT_0020688793 /DNA_START=765 /DNA_END=1104 /DNA_ORIENTATION=+